MPDWLLMVGVVALLIAPIWFGALASYRKQNGLLWGLALGLAGLVVGQFIRPRPLIDAYAVGIVVCLLPALIALAVVGRKRV